LLPGRTRHNRMSGNALLTGSTASLNKNLALNEGPPRGARNSLI
jgi:hypothetical protein